MNLELNLSNENITIQKVEIINKNLLNANTIQVTSKLEYIPEWLLNHVHIKSLSFKDKKLTDHQILNPFSSGPYLKTCEEERLNYIPEEICLFKNIRILSVDFLIKKGMIEILPSNIGNLRNLENLLFSNHKIKELPESLTECKNISWVSLYNNPFINFPEPIYELESLETLSIGSEFYKSIEVNVTKLLQLKKIGSLSLHNCSIKKFPMEFGKFKNLYALDLSHNNIEQLPIPHEIKRNFPLLNFLRLDSNPIFENDYDFCNNWRMELNKYDINVNFN